MPTIAQSKATPEEVAAALAAVNTSPVGGAPAGLAPAPAIPNYPEGPSFLRSSLPSTQLLQPDTTRLFYRKGTPQTRIAPLPANAQPAINAAAKTVASTIIEESGGTLLETNGVENADQSTLNLKAGSNVTLQADAFGGVTIAASGGGTPPWTPNQVTWLEDFTSLGPGQTASTDSIEGGSSFGNLGWYLFTTESGIVTNGLVNAGVPPFTGYVWWSNNATASMTARLYPAGLMPNTFSTGTDGFDYSANIMPLFDYPGWQVSFVFRLSQYLQATTTEAFSMAQKALYVGLHGINPGYYSNLSTAGSRPNKFCGVRFDTSTTSPSLGDTTFVLEVVNNYVPFNTNSRVNAQGTTLVTSETPTNGKFYRLDIVSTERGSATITLSGGATVASMTQIATLTATMPDEPTFPSTPPVQSTIGQLLGGNYANTEPTSGFVEAAWESRGSTTIGSTTYYVYYDYTSVSVGSIVTCEFLTGSAGAMNGLSLTVKAVEYVSTIPAWLIQFFDSSLTAGTVSIQPTPGEVSGEFQLGPYFTNYPAMYPGAWFGNDDTASPTALTAVFEVDKIFFNWIPG
jgi:hypothetical protein